MQSNVIFGFVSIAFLFYITSRGELPIYLTILRGGGQQPDNSSSNASGIGNLFGNIYDLANGNTISAQDVLSPIDTPGDSAVSVSGENNPLDVFSGGFF